uniref:Sacsin molecular chaperone n=1 Tax=Rousettus aegyptiacus TaxID=9407 RepID=A0A7J8DZD0_ROUAE|nr:sacsin molecular chaperone [Rousettus aegyptiacus]
METKDNRWLRVTVLPGCVGCRTVAVLESWTVRDLKERILAETGFPVSEQRLWLGDRELSDWIKFGDLTFKNRLFVKLQSKGLKGGGRFGQTTPPLVDFLKDILRRYPEGGQILKGQPSTSTTTQFSPRKTGTAFRKSQEAGRRMTL